MLEQARRSTHDTARHVTPRLAQHVLLVVSWRVVTWRNKWNLGLTLITVGHASHHWPYGTDFSYIHLWPTGSNAYQHPACYCTCDLSSRSFIPKGPCISNVAAFCVAAPSSFEFPMVSQDALQHLCWPGFIQIFLARGGVRQFLGRGLNAPKTPRLRSQSQNYGDGCTTVSVNVHLLPSPLRRCK